MSEMDTLSRLIDERYFTIVCRQSGFVRGYLLEQIDDSDRAQLVQIWENQAALEAFRGSGLMDQIFQDLQRSLPGLTTQGQSYALRLEKTCRESASV